MANPSTPASDRLRILVLGYLVRGPLGGLAWHHLQYAMGLSRLGHDVYFLEDSEDYPSCYDPVRHVTGADPTFGLAFAEAAFSRLELADRWTYYDAHTGRWLGPASRRALELCDSADVVLNLSGVNPLRAWLLEVPHRVLIDTDPVFTQIRHLTDPAARELAARHTAFFSFGENIGKTSSTVPADGFCWRPTRQPVVLDAWAVTPGPDSGRFTTVMQWESYQSRQYDGRRFGMKSASFDHYFDLPCRTTAALEIALGSPSAPRERLAYNGWTIRDALDSTRDPWTYQDYIGQSKGEFAVAKHGYVTSRCGWFSERSAVYLASGRPVVVQETGFSDWLPTGSGVLTFSDPAEAVLALAEVNGRYAAHCRAAREIAVEYFDCGRVLPRLIEEAMETGGAEHNADPRAHDEAVARGSRSDHAAHPGPSARRRAGEP